MSRRSFQLSTSRFVEKPEVNLTPLIDVVFVILIAFIVLAPLLELDRVELADASGAVQGSSVSVQEASPISIHVRQDNSIIVNGQRMTFEELTEYLKRAKLQYPLAKPQLFHDRKAHFGTYQAVKNAAEIAGFQQMDVVLKPG
ncbi:MAG: biopolymer transporter ExbD [Parachlamydiaceae bacterium]